MNLLIAILCVVICIVVLKKWNGSKNSPPGPLTLPLIGSAWAFGNKPKHLHITLTNLAAKYGPIYKIMLAKTPFVVLSDSELIKEAFTGSNPPVLLRFVSKTFRMADTGESLFYAFERSHWAVLRKVCSPMIRNMPGGVTINQTIREEMEKLFIEIDKHVGKEVYLNPLFMYFARNVFMRILHRHSWSFDKPKEEDLQFIKSMIRVLEISTSPIDFIPALDFLRNKTRKEIFYHRSIIDAYLKQILDNRRKDPVASSDYARDLLDILLLEIEQNPEVSERDIISTLRSLFTAATATVSDSLDWMLLFLCTNPEIQEKCYKEIKDKLQGRPATMDDQPDLPYLDNVIKETFRLRPPAPLAVLHIAERDCTIGGYLIEKDSVVVQNLYGTGNLEMHYENSSKFDPERWARNPELSSKLVHFGTGPTICLGMPIAKQEMFLAATSLLQKYKFAFGPSSPVPDFTGG